MFEFGILLALAAVQLQVVYWAMRCLGHQHREPSPPLVAMRRDCGCPTNCACGTVKQSPHCLYHIQGHRQLSTQERT